MGQLSALKTPTINVPINDKQSIDVRGLAFEDFFEIARSHGPEASMLFAKIVNHEKIEADEIMAIMKGLLPQCPKLVATVIALACDDASPEGLKVAGKLKPAVQLAALEAIFLLTIESEAELKKFMESILRMLAGTTKLVQQMRLPLSEAGFGDSVVQ